MDIIQKTKDLFTSNPEPTTEPTEAIQPPAVQAVTVAAALATEPTPEQWAKLQDYTDTGLRPAMGDIARLLNRVAPVLAAYNGEISGILALLDTNTEIPNKSGLAGISTLTSGEVATMSHYIETLLALNTDAHLQGYVKAAGTRNTRDR